MRIPAATYRLQFTPEFGFSDAEAVLPYLHELGITDIYASPIFYARAGSKHGYDVVVCPCPWLTGDGRDGFRRGVIGAAQPELYRE